MKKVFFLMLSILLSLGCKSQNSLKKSKSTDIYDVLKAFSEKHEKPKIFIKSLKSKNYNKDFILNIKDIRISYVNKRNRKFAESKIDSLKAINIYSKNELDSISYIVTKDYFVPKIEGFLTDEDIENMANTFKEKRVVWNEYELEELNLTNNRGDIHLSVPVFSTNGMYSILLVNYSNSLTLDIYIKQRNKKWEFYCSGLVYRAD